MEKTKIVICDDDLGILDVLDLILEMEGFEITKVSDSTLLMNHLATDQPDLLILDLWMPVLSGYDIIKMLRSHDEQSHLPILILSASRNEEQTALDAGATTFMSKPFNIDELVKTVKELLG